MWSADDPLLQELFSENSNAIPLAQSSLETGQLRLLSGESVRVSRETVGESARVAVLAAVALAEALAIPPAKITAFLAH